MESNFNTSFFAIVVILCFLPHISCGYLTNEEAKVVVDYPFVKLLYSPERYFVQSEGDEDEAYEPTDCDLHIEEYMGRLMNFTAAFSFGEQTGWAFRSM